MAAVIIPPDTIVCGHPWQQWVDQATKFHGISPTIEQVRDFIYAKDVVRVIHFLMQRQPSSAIYNLGTGNARTFLDLATSTFRAMDLEPHIEYIDTPADIRDKYQYFTEARMEKLRAAGYTEPFYSLEDGVEEYVQEFLMHNRYF